MKLNFKNLTMTATLFGSMVFAPTLMAEPRLGHPTGLPQNDIDQESAGSFDNHKSTDRYLDAPATTKARANAVKTRDMHAAGPDSKIMNNNDSTVMSVQKALTDLDYAPGEADGLMGANTMAALAKFQRDNEITPTGRLNAETLEALEIDNRSMFNDDIDSEAFAE